jgi:hypothetical protein
MDTKQMPYVHLLQFVCRQCGKPLVISVASDAANLEKIDSDSYSVKCQCGWLDRLIGVEAARHWVTPSCDQQNLIDHLIGVRDEGLSNRP